MLATIAKPTGQIIELPGPSVDSQRLFLYMGLLFICLLIYQAWVIDYGPKPVTDTASGLTEGGVATGVADTGPVSYTHLTLPTIYSV